MDVDFVIPLSTDDLLNGEPGCYVVEEVFSCRSLPNKLADCFVDLRTQGPCAIIETFDAYFSLIRHFNDVENALRDEALQTLLKAFKQLINDISPMVEQGDADPETRKRHLNALKMTCYLLVQISSLYESDATKPTTQVSAPKGRGKSCAASKKKSTSKSFEWDSERDRVIELLGHVLQLDINRLWDPPIVEEEFVNLVTGFCYKLLENPVVTKAKITKDLVFNMLGTVVKKYSTGLSTSLKIVQLIQHFEHLVPHLSQAVDLIATEFGVKGIVAEIIREIGMMNPADLTKDTSGTRAYADFIVDLTSRIPSLVLNNISLLICHLDGESYSMRNGVLGAMGEIVLKVLSSGELDDNAKNLRDQFLDKLEAHLHDTNAYVRSKALQIWLQLCNNMAIPLPRQQHLLELVIGRLHDKSSSVRKYAVQLLKCFLVNNPFGAKLPLDHLKGKLTVEMEKLKEMAPHLTQKSDNQVPVVLACAGETWKAIEPEVKATVEEYIAQEDEEDNDDEQTDESEPKALTMTLKEIKQLLNEGYHKKALTTLKKAQRKWPNEAVLHADTVNKGNLFEEENESEEVDKDKLVAEELSILKAIFLAPEDGAPQESAEEEEELNPEALLDAANQNTDENNIESNSDGLVNEISKQQLVVQYLQDYVNFQTQMEKAVPVICQLLGSKTISDVSESIEFFGTAYEFGLRNAIFGVRRMLVLIWSRDAAVKDSVVEAYKGLYLDPPSPNQRTKTALIVKNMIALTHGASIGDLTSLEELMSELMKGKLIPGPVIKLLWEKFTMKVSQTTAEESRAALILLGMLASAEMDIIRSNVDVLVKSGLGTRAEEDFLLARDTCVALLKLNKKSKTSRGGTEEPFRFPASHAIFERLSQIIVSGIRKVEDTHWIPMAEQAINVIYALSEHPDTICEEIIRKIAVCLIDKETRQSPIPEDGQDTQTQDEASGPQNGLITIRSCHSTMLARFLHLSGHVALRQLVHLDSSILKEIKRRQCVQENEKEKERQDKQAGKDKRSNNTTTNTTKDTTTTETAEEEMGLTGATSDDVETEYIRNICEQDIVTGQNLLALLRPLLVCVCSNPTKFNDHSLQAAAALALAKFMMVSSQFCEGHLQLLFTILEKSPQANIRANTIIAVGDLTFRFPNLLEPWTSHLYARLREDSPHVRKNTMMVLTHLILNDMVKVKGNISEMATCLEDKDKRIADLAKLFFLELSKKGNAVYNVLPDIISRLSDPDCGIEEEPFRNILRYMLSFIQKDRQSESLVEKLCHRFRATRCDRQWRDLAFCLSLLPYNERAIRKLNENFGCFHDKLSDEDVHQSFMTIIGKSKKFAKIELKTLVEELEQRIDECHNKGMDDEAGYERASKASGMAAKTKKSVSATPSGKSTRSRKGVTPARGRRKKTVDDDSDSEEDPAAGSKTTACTPRNPRVRPPKSAKRQSTKKRKQMPSFESDDDDDDVELFDLEEEDEDDEEISDDENIEPNQGNVKNKSSKKKVKNKAKGSTSTSKSRSIRT
ncbi:condensin complex subunit 1-like [Actinia tenebrosa]|uniref:Condensin complex subunit 1 n=1 Tax=Actinia tenebrosa TaxID=6105 RepID=A0A6P8IB37_ACTTE|nr:condensin complex subunit 1-like [Actinia tenebrosa]